VIGKIDNSLHKVIARSLRKSFDWKSDPSITHLISGGGGIYGVQYQGVEYILKVYQPNFIASNDLLMQLKLLKYLRLNNILCCEPISHVDGSLYGTVELAKEQRFWVLLEKAQGRMFTPYTPPQVQQLGKTIANLHQIARRFPEISDYPRLSIDWLIYKPCQYITREMIRLGFNTGSFLESVDWITHHIQGITEDKTYFSIVHGDPHFSNMHFTEDNVPMLFDFDASRYGCAMFDIAFMCLLGKSLKHRDSNLQLHFLDGYQSVRRLSQTDLNFISPLMAGFHIMAMGHHCRFRGVKYPEIDRDYIANNLKALLNYGDKDGLYSVCDNKPLEKNIPGDTLE